MRELVKYVMIAIVGLGLVFLTGTAFSADVTGKTSTHSVPTQSSTQTAPLPSKTKTVTLPSTTREYQQVDKPPVQKLDVPDWDLAGELRNLQIMKKTHRTAFRRTRYFNGLKFQVALMNKGKRKGSKDVPIKVTVVNITNNTLIKQESHLMRRQNIRNDYWELTPDIIVQFRLSPTTASSINDVKLIVDVDPRNTFGEAQRHRGNNRCVATW